jgi:hypothetical protein
LAGGVGDSTLSRPKFQKVSLSHKLLLAFFSDPGDGVIFIPAVWFFPAKSNQLS